MRKLKNIELKRKNIQEFKNAEKTRLIIILDNVRSLNNIGSVFRTCDAFLIEKIYATTDWYDINFSKIDIDLFYKVSPKELKRISSLKSPNNVLAVVKKRNLSIH